ncbi:putative NAD(P)H quinone oxidoreductase, PIG3 family [Fodinibius salinus]|uniref:Putative NAD(P)H quinone oxidoreductase, PIG3 family n=1 Tax=Fodinibius salinus TaxID=860790 RepID=A0A5D3YFP5_9BACT|nr:NAD(P)H-quinone oxidoreductase [Fodinibius salinus]TYP91718.1 putative NAD(P)H quinone oxidoreductase, PIG3 family [Fodinibius salinus]
MKAIQVIQESSGSALKIGEVPTPEPDENELLVKIRSTAINRADLLQRTGNYDPPEGASNILGLEISGVVEKVGSEVTEWENGDRIFGLLPGGGYAEYCTIHEDMAMGLPDNLSFEEAAAIPETFLTAFQTLDWLAELQEQETVLIHAAGSGVGTSAIQLAYSLYEARIIATAGKQHKLDTAKELGANFAYNYKEQNYAEEIISDIGADSVNVVIDFIGKPYWHKNMEVLAMDGRLVYLSFLGGHKVENISLIPILRKRLSIMGSTLRNRTEEYKIDLTKDFASKTLSLFKDGKLKPVIDSVFDWSETETAHQRMKNNKNTGKIVLTDM